MVTPRWGQRWGDGQQDRRSAETSRASSIVRLGGSIHSGGSQMASHTSFATPGALARGGGASAVIVPETPDCSNEGAFIPAASPQRAKSKGSFDLMTVPYPCGLTRLKRELLLEHAAHDDPSAVDRLLACHREPLRRMIAVRLDRSLGRREDASDVVQGVLLEASRRLADYLRNPGTAVPALAQADRPRSTDRRAPPPSRGRSAQHRSRAAPRRRRVLRPLVARPGRGTARPGAHAQQPRPFAVS